MNHQMSHSHLIPMHIYLNMPNPVKFMWARRFNLNITHYIILTLLCFVHRWHRFALVSRKLGNMFKTFYKSCIPVFNKFLSSVFMSQGTSASGRKNLFRMVFFSNNFSLALKKNKDKNIDETVKDTKIWLF